MNGFPPDFVVQLLFLSLCLSLLYVVLGLAALAIEPFVKRWQERQNDNQL